MNLVILMGRLTRDPEYREGETPMAKYAIAVDRFKEGADFINCVCFGNTAKFADTYLHKGTKVAVIGRIQTGKYQNKEGKTVHTTDVVVSNHYFCESAGTRVETPAPPRPETPEGGFVDIPEYDSELPFR